MITLNIADVKAAGLKAYNEKRLSAQGPAPRCMYRDEHGHPCVIGAAMTDEEAQGLSRSSNLIGIAVLEANGYVQSDDIADLARGQDMHDSWALSMRQPDALYESMNLSGDVVKLLPSGWEEETLKWLSN